MGVFTPRVDGQRELALADTAIKEGRLEEALQLAKEAIAALRKSGEVKAVAQGNAKVLQIQALQYVKEQSLENASGAYKQSAQFYKQAGMPSQYTAMMKEHIQLQQKIGQSKAQEKSFESAATSYETAALALRDLGQMVDSYELRAKACVFRAASVRNLGDRKSYLMQAVNLIKESGINQPVMHGHLAYYTAMVQRISDPRLAMQTLNDAISHYQLANNQQMVQTARSMQQSLEQQLDQ